MGVWTDEGVPGRVDYLNQPLNRWARLMAAGHGGQVLLSGATELLVRDDLPDGCALVDLGAPVADLAQRDERVGRGENERRVELEPGHELSVMELERTGCANPSSRGAVRG